MSKKVETETDRRGTRIAALQQELVDTPSALVPLSQSRWSRDGGGLNFRRWRRNGSSYQCVLGWDFWGHE